MPELPEVETVRAGLARHVLDRPIADVDVLGPLGARVTRRQLGGADELRARLVGRTFAAAVRRGKFLWLPLAEDGGPTDEALLVHLGMSGQMLLPTGAPEPHPHLRVRITLADGGLVDFHDQRTFGHLVVTDLVPTPDGGPGGFAGDRAAEPALPVEVAHIARDLLDPLMAEGTEGRAALVRCIRRSPRGVKRALLDQELVSGIGNIYADEALWIARLHHERPGDRLPAPRVRALLAAATEVMSAALAVGGTSFDSLYVDVNGSSGYFDRSLHVYGREGRPCERCGTPIRREAFANRSSFRCPRCQRRPVGTGR
ncbi:MAG TPA: bifunctional DNA-formamidopyrimidine glycosylase/DNA-(apurinic or apyrimidinic site) lyase [Actinotalea caeni]|uniref:bifunctional DNA-formamidopyrimidine glycosylase/DNA-(apurinic or apyrimidinic site) lyase n=1 Tax=Actinotalea caeni TaxID=1348467 RepID=UPI002B4B24C3|nr:bifunctional DNA-formamidopyrimidine glycosylase/DNA-(apurinic or apyrimidinic site) lyase [Actinotalea caeni]HLV55723.1 bifunctional DNA-formamidopyrimidine glycosylase/DNA-(apurinic or apyrimidinic site) lyase [Actinotalea caeni]